MKNDQIYPFIRDRFYKGKLLMSTDFQTEQDYTNNKRRFGNRVFRGSGILTGLSVYNLDDVSIMVESGAALDAGGREIVLEKSIVRKLSAIEGFENLAGDSAYLCVRYEETAVHQVYAMNRQSESGEYEANRYREGCALFLINLDQLPPEDEPETEFFTSTVLYSGDDYRIEIILPMRVPCGCSAKVRLCAQKLTAEPKDLEFRCLLQAPSCFTPDGSHEHHAELSGVDPGEGQTISTEFLLTAQAEPALDGAIMIGASNARIMIGGEPKTLADNVILGMAITDMDSYELAKIAVGRVPLEAIRFAAAEEGVALAELKLRRAKNTYVIEGIRDRGVRHYITGGGNVRQRREMASWYHKPEKKALPKAPEEKPEEQQEEEQQALRSASGVTLLEIREESKSGKLAVSTEIAHGLGRGKVFVKAGFVHDGVDTDEAQQTETIFGSPDLFESKRTALSAAELAVRISEARETFTIAAMLPPDYTAGDVKVRWKAARLPDSRERSLLARMDGRNIIAEPSTMVIGPREQQIINVRFSGMEPCTLVYELTEKASGRITTDGIYTSPSKEGVYEIRISCAELPLINTYAYAVVKKNAAKKNTPEAEAEK